MYYLRGFVRALLGLLAVVVVAMTTTVSWGQELTFTAETVTGDGSVTPSLSWNTVPAADSCVASGAADWSGPRPPTGAVVLAPVMFSATYNLECTWPGDARATLSWQAPATNTNGTPYTDPGGFRVYWGPGAGNLPNVANIPDPAARSFVVQPLSPGLWFFALSAYNQRGIESALTSPVSKTATASAGVTRSVGITVNPVPGSPEAVAVQ